MFDRKNCINCFKLYIFRLPQTNSCLITSANARPRIVGKNLGFHVKFEIIVQYTLQYLKYSGV